MNKIIVKVMESPKTRFKNTELIDTRAAEKINLLIEVTTPKEFKNCLTNAQFTIQNLKELSSTSDNPIFRGAFSIEQVARIIDWDCVISIEEDTEIRAEDKK